MKSVGGLLSLVLGVLPLGSDAAWAKGNKKKAPPATHLSYDSLIEAHYLMAQGLMDQAQKKMDSVFAQKQFWPWPLAEVLEKLEDAQNFLKGGGDHPSQREAAVLLGLASPLPSPQAALQDEIQGDNLSKFKETDLQALKRTRSVSLARSIPFNSHKNSCQPLWTYAQFVLAREARSRQNRSAFFFHQQKLSKQLRGGHCSPKLLEMSAEEFSDFRFEELLWNARLLWENAQNTRARDLAQGLLGEALHAKDSKRVLEVSQVLFGRITFESESPQTNVAMLEDLQKKRVALGLKSPELEDFLGFRLALFAYMGADYKKCALVLQSPLDQQREILNSASLQDKRDFAQFLYWHSKCTAKTGASIEPARAEMRVHGGTSYYAMAFEQDFPAPLSGNGVETPEESIDPWVPSAFLAGTQETMAILKRSKKFSELPLESPLVQLPLTWLTAKLKGNEGELFEHSRDSLKQLYNLMLRVGNTQEVIFSAGRLAQNFSRDQPGSKFVLSYLYPKVFAQAFASASAHCGVDLHLLYAVSRQESLYNPKAQSHAGARGLLQIMPAVWQDLKKKHPDWKLSDDPFDVNSNLLAGACHLKEGMLQFEKIAQGDEARALVWSLSAYNAGLDAARSWIARRFQSSDLRIFVEFIPYGETQNYVKQITRSVYFLGQLNNALSGQPDP